MGTEMHAGCLSESCVYLGNQIQPSLTSQTRRDGAGCPRTRSYPRDCTNETWSGGTFHLPSQVHRRPPSTGAYSALRSIGDPSVRAPRPQDRRAPHQGWPYITAVAKTSSRKLYIGQSQHKQEDARSSSETVASIESCGGNTLSGFADDIQHQSSVSPQAGSGFLKRGSVDFKRSCWAGDRISLVFGAFLMWDEPANAKNETIIE